ncbi:variant leucine-rich repeat-containing protein [Nesterenkonia haasae]|uniref:variant leucine-rich repeat-containing protein n=1 Tax=Nesterenkonia haasae TaxID=2587813 RepID=UPI0013915751|nr:hypothetical protein [Nesterenkonia haasae]NDK32418.1 hypothetical protein [Nesterenkonia haasae]
MTQRDPASYTAEDLTYQSVQPEVLRQVASTRPDLWDDVLAHPNCYPALATFIRQQRGETPPPAVTQPGPQSQRQPLWRLWAQVALPALAFFAILALFLPIATVSMFGYSESFNYLHAEAPSGEGALMMILFILVIAAGVSAVLLRVTWARITAAVLGILAGLLGSVNGFGTISALGREPMVSLGVGIVLLALTSVAMIVAAVITLLPAITVKTQEPISPARS